MFRIPLVTTENVGDVIITHKGNSNKFDKSQVRY